MSDTRTAEAYRVERAALDAHLDRLFADWQTRRASAVAAFEAKWADVIRVMELEEARRFAAKHQQQELRAWGEPEALLVDA